jgi:hypothetical protein
MLKSFDGQGLKEGDSSDIAYVPRNATRRHLSLEWGGCAWSFEARGKYRLVEACDTDSDATTWYSTTVLYLCSLTESCLLDY